MAPQGSKASYSGKQKRMARHIEQSERSRGRNSKSAGRIAWATVNKRTGGARGRKSAGKSASKSARSSRSQRSRGRKSSRSH